MELLFDAMIVGLWKSECGEAVAVMKLCLRVVCWSRSWRVLRNRLRRLRFGILCAAHLARANSREAAKKKCYFYTLFDHRRSLRGFKCPFARPSSAPSLSERDDIRTCRGKVGNSKAT